MARPRLAGHQPAVINGRPYRSEGVKERLVTPRGGAPLLQTVSSTEPPPLSGRRKREKGGRVLAIFPFPPFYSPSPFLVPGTAAWNLVLGVGDHLVAAPFIFSDIVGSFVSPFPVPRKPEPGRQAVRRNGRASNFSPRKCPELGSFCPISGRRFTQSRPVSTLAYTAASSLGLHPPRVGFEKFYLPIASTI